MFLMVIRGEVGSSKSNQCLLGSPGVSEMTEPLIWFVGHLAGTGQDGETNSPQLEGKREWKTEDKRQAGEQKGF